jgi:diguanylate cyclase (GGDEF)-like protein/PAS domain S-box-containing protein
VKLPGFQNLRKPSRFGMGIVLANVAVLVILASTVAYSLVQSHQTYSTRARETSVNLAHALSLSIGAEIKQIDNALQSVVLQLQRLDGPKLASAEEIGAVAMEQQRLVPQVDSIRVTDAQGNRLNAGEALPVADRPFFDAAREAPGRLVISEPVQGRITRKWGIALARARFDAAGHFQGIVYAKLSADWLFDVFDDMSIGEHGAVSMRTDTMHLVARYTPGVVDHYAGLGSSEVSAQLRAAVASSPAQGSFVSVTAMDHMRRVNAFERVQGYSPFVLVGVSTDDFYDPWRTEVRNEVVLAGILEALIVGLSLQFYRRHEHQVRSRRAALALAEEQQALLDNQLVGMVKVKNRQEVWHNRAFSALFGYEEDELSGLNTRILYPDDESYAQVGLASAAMTGHGQFRLQTRMVRKDGRLMWIDLSGAALPDGELLWMMVDVTAVKDSEIEARHRASHDSLTGLLNRAALLEKLGDKLLDSAASGHPLAVCYIDLDGFKGINDRFGHEAGDRFLTEAGERLLAAVRAGDLVARLGGDEFVAVLCELDGADELATIVSRMVRDLSRPLEVRGGSPMPIGASIGVAVYPTHGREAELLLRRADAAMYEAKRAGKNRFVICSDDVRPVNA